MHRLCAAILAVLMIGSPTAPDPTDIKTKCITISVEDIQEDEEELPGLLAPCGLTAEELAEGLQGELAGYAADFIQAESTYDINAVFLASVAAVESGWGAFRAAPNNLFGWTGNNGYMAFESVQDCIDFVARNIRRMYLTPGGSCFNGYEVEDICIYYNGNPAWAEAVRGIMEDIERRIEECI